MCPPAAAPPADIGFYCPDEELFMSLEKIINGSPLPGNVITDVNPYHYMPSNLPGGIWYFLSLEEKKDTDFGFWKAKGEACRIFSNSILTGWRTTFEFHEGQAPHGHKTDWMMLEYRITQKGQCENSKAKEINSLCRMFLNGDRSPIHEMQNLDGADFNSEKPIQSIQSLILNADNETGQGSSSNSLVNKDDETGPLTARERSPEHCVEYLPEIDYLSRGDYLELLDLENPESPSCSSANSSCLTMSSDECFDVALLQELEPENNKDLVQKEAGCKFSVTTSLRPNEVVMCPTPSDKEVLKHANKKANYSNEGPSSNFHNVAASSSGHTATPDGDGEKKVLIGRMRKLKKKYLCFMPF